MRGSFNSWLNKYEQGNGWRQGNGAEGGGWRPPKEGGDNLSNAGNRRAWRPGGTGGTGGCSEESPKPRWSDRDRGGGNRDKDRGFGFHDKGRREASVNAMQEQASEEEVSSLAGDLDGAHCNNLTEAAHSTISRCPYFVMQKRVEAIAKAIHEKDSDPTALKDADPTELTLTIGKVMTEAAEDFLEQYGDDTCEVFVTAASELLNATVEGHPA